MSKININKPDIDNISDVEQYRKLPDVKAKPVRKLPEKEKNKKLDVLLQRAKKRNPFVSLDMKLEDMEIFKEATMDQVTWELTQLYLTVEQLVKEDDSLELKNGLKALEDQIRLLEYLHKGRTALIMD